MNAINKNIEKLVNDKIDGVLSREGHEELEKILSSSEEARSYMDHMLALHSILGHAGNEKADIDVSKEVMERIRQLPCKQKPIRTFHINALMSVYNKQLMRYAAALLVGLLLGTAASYTLFNWRTGIERENSRATMSGRTGQAIEASGNSWQLYTQPMVLGDMALLVVSLKTLDDASVSISYDHNAFKHESTRFLNEAAPARSSAVPGQVVIESPDDVVFQIVFRRTTGTRTALTLTLKQGENLVHQREIYF